MLEIQTDRLRLFPLTLEQLGQYLNRPEELEQALGYGISRTIVTDTLTRAITMKLAKMEKVPAEQHAWYSYWLIVTKQAPFGAGLAGYKGIPDENGEAEIGYGIDPAYGKQGYMTEAVLALIDWAFQDKACKSVIAPDTMRSNIASNRVLEKAGMYVYGETQDAFHWRIDKLSKDKLRN